MPINTLANTINKDEYTSMNLEESLNDEEITPKFSKYTENDKQIIIYLFRGKGCSFCKSFLNYLNGIVNEYGEYFKLVSYDVWSDSKNSTLMMEVSNFLGEPAEGVPYIIIGDKVFPGYIDSFNESIETAIMDLYKSKNRYDVFEEMEKVSYEEEDTETETIPTDTDNNNDYSTMVTPSSSSSSKFSLVVIIFNAIFVIASTILTILFINYKDKKLENKIEELNNTINANK